MATSAEAVKIQNLSSETAELLQGLFQGHSDGFCRAGPGGYLLPANFAAHADALRRVAVRRDDAWVVTYPRSGTTLVQEMVWLVANNLDYAAARRTSLVERFPIMELFPFLHEQIQNPGLLNWDDELKAGLIALPDYRVVEAAPSPRFLKSHLPLSLLPAALLDTARVVYVARDPRDVAVSFYHLNRLFKVHDFIGDFKTFWDLFVEDTVLYTPYFGHLKEAWAQRDHPNMLFMFYEDIVKDKPAAIRRVSKFFGKEYSEDEIKKLSDHLDIESFRTNESINLSFFQPMFNINEEPFIRKGKTGAWRDSFDADMRRQAARWLRRHLAGTNLRFPSEVSDDE